MIFAASHNPLWIWLPFCQTWTWSRHIPTLRVCPIYGPVSRSNAPTWVCVVDRLVRERERERTYLFLCLCPLKRRCNRDLALLSQSGLEILQSGGHVAGLLIYGGGHVHSAISAMLDQRRTEIPKSFSHVSSHTRCTLVLVRGRTRLHKLKSWLFRLEIDQNSIFRVFDGFDGLRTRRSYTQDQEKNEDTHDEFWKNENFWVFENFFWILGVPLRGDFGEKERESENFDFLWWRTNNETVRLVRLETIYGSMDVILKYVCV